MGYNHYSQLIYRYRVVGLSPPQMVHGGGLTDGSIEFKPSQLWLYYCQSTYVIYDTLGKKKNNLLVNSTKSFKSNIAIERFHFH